MQTRASQCCEPNAGDAADGAGLMSTVAESVIYAVGRCSLSTESKVWAGGAGPALNVVPWMPQLSRASQTNASCSHSWLALKATTLDVCHHSTLFYIAYIQSSDKTQPCWPVCLSSAAGI
jgi:hypothetical protein